MNINWIFQEYNYHINVGDTFGTLPEINSWMQKSYHQHLLWFCFSFILLLQNYIWVVYSSSYRSCNNSPQTWWLKTTEMYSCTGLEVGSPKSVTLGQNQGVNVWKALEKIHSKILPGFGNCYHALICGPVTPGPACGHTALFLPVIVSPWHMWLNLGTAKIISHLNIFNLITSAEFFSTKNSTNTLQGLGCGCVTRPRG